MHAVCNYRDKVLSWTGANTEEESVRKFTSIRGENWAKHLQDGYRVVTVGKMFKIIRGRDD